MPARKHTTETVGKYFLEQNCILISEYENTDKTIYYICSCGTVAKTNFSSFRKGSRCVECAKIKRFLTVQRKGGYEYKNKYIGKKIYTHCISNKCYRPCWDRNLCIKHSITGKFKTRKSRKIHCK